MNTTTDPVPEAPLPATASQAPAAGRRFHWAVRALLVAVLMFGNYVPFLLVNMVLGRLGLAKDMSLEAQVIIGALLQFLLPAAAITFVWLLMRFVDRRPLRETGLFFDKGSLAALGLGIAVSAAVAIPVAFALNAAGLARPGESRGLPVWAAVLMTIMMGLVLQGFPEELLWRGYLMQTLPWTNRWGVALFSAGLFGAMHVVSGGGQQNAFEQYVLYPLQAVAFAFAAAALYQATGQLWAAVGIHAGLHFAHGITGDLGGPWVWTAESLGFVLVACAVLVWIDRTHPDYPAAGRRLPA